eukprot:2884307-Rhodomonas_salina.1
MRCSVQRQSAAFAMTPRVRTSHAALEARSGCMPRVSVGCRLYGIGIRKQRCAYRVGQYRRSVIFSRLVVPCTQTVSTVPLREHA